MKEQETTFASGDLSLAGSIMTPDGHFDGTAAVLVVGSGRIDRNSDAKRLPLGVTRELAGHLAEQGIATLRYDKRGVGESEGEYLTSGFSDNVNDARAALEFLRQEHQVDADRVFVIGHSEGALIATALAGAGAPAAGAVLLAGAAESGEEILRRQAADLPDMLPGLVQRLNRLLRIDVERSQLKRIERLKASTGDVERMQLVVKVNARWFREFMTFDPAATIADAHIPILAITGANDAQVVPGDVEKLARATQAPFEGHVIDGMNHILRKAGPSPLQYKKQLGLPLDPEMLEVVSTWLLERAAARPEANQKKA